VVARLATSDAARPSHDAADTLDPATPNAPKRDATAIAFRTLRSGRAGNASDDSRGRIRRFDEIETRLRAACARPADHVQELAAVRALLDELGARSMFATNESEIAKLVAELVALDAAIVRTAAIAGERAQLVVDHEASRPAAAELADAAAIDRVRAVAVDTEARVARHAATLAADDDARRRRDEALQLLSDDEAKAEIDRILGAVIGSHDGKLFRSFAQSLTLDALLAVANAHLEELAPRYQLERIPRHDLEIQVIDRDLGAEVRSVQSLSGGESFLVSLALALGLSSMSAHDVRVRTLLIDEGFGTLDPTALDTALSVLDALQATGRQIGVISHVPALIERVGAHVRVVQRGGGRSDVIVAS
nr:exonuclease [Deltaproteobacteria bacterium]